MSRNRFFALFLGVLLEMTWANSGGEVSNVVRYSYEAADHPTWLTGVTYAQSLGGSVGSDLVLETTCP